MRTIFRHLLALAVVLAAVATPRAVFGQAFKVIVNSGNATEELSADQASKIFLKQAKFPSGAAATPVDQPKSAATRGEFTKTVHGKTVAAIESYWQQQIFSGKDVPPAAKPTDADVVAFVKATPGAIGYVSASADVGGVKVVAIK